MPTAKKLLVFAAVLAALSGCATKKDFYATGGSRADGSVDMAYDFAQFEQPVVNIAQAQSIAKSKCRVWGYNGAEAFGGKQTNMQPVQWLRHLYCRPSDLTNTSASVTSAKLQ